MKITRLCYETLLILCTGLLFCLNVNAQTDDSYLYYKKQFTELTVTRSGTASEAGKALEAFNKNQINSNESFAAFLKKVYSQKKSIGILLFFFRNDTLNRLFFEPGQLMEEVVIPITRQRLAEMGDDLNTALNVYMATENRAPVKRGITIKPPSASPKNIDTVITTLTNLLIPASFNEKYRHLIVIPCLNIGVIPFQLLKPYKDTTYMVDHCSITIAPTLVDFVGLRYELLFNIKAEGFDPTMSKEAFDVLVSNGSLAETDSISMNLDKSLFVSNPEYPKNGTYIFPDLPGAESEVKNAIAYSKTYTLLHGREAVKDSVLKHLDGTDLAYFATHGVASSTQPDDSSYLVLTGNHPYLTSLEIKDLRFRKDITMPPMVILSACQTGLGQYMEAGVMGSLARAFLLAGSNHVIMSLWSVDDKATSYLMNRYLYHLHHPGPFFPSEPLRMAMVDTKKVFPNPLYWAGFSLIGADY